MSAWDDDRDGPPISGVAYDIYLARRGIVPGMADPDPDPTPAPAPDTTDAAARTNEQSSPEDGDAS